MAGLSGKIFSLSGKVGGARTPHPHLVAIELSEHCLMIPHSALAVMRSSNTKD